MPSGRQTSNSPQPGPSTASSSSAAAKAPTKGWRPPASSSESRTVKNNKGRYSSEAECLAHHKRLVDKTIEITTRETKIGNLTRGTLLQTVVRIHVSQTPRISSVLRSLFFDLFREHAESAKEGFEVVTTFNAILKSDVSGASFFTGFIKKVTTTTTTDCFFCFSFMPTHVHPHRIPPPSPSFTVWIIGPAAAANRAGPPLNSNLVIPLLSRGSRT